MDIVSRLKRFIEYRKIPVTQFADSCGIPRPTLSQLLNGRNKKVSDEVINKIHEAFPSLSVMWLLFGEGDMVVAGNTQSSEPQTEGSISFSMPEVPADERVVTTSLFDDDFSGKAADSKSPVTSGIEAAARATEITFIEEKGAEKSSSQPDASKRKVSHIIVYYSDNTFETFIPQ